MNNLVGNFTGMDGRINRQAWWIGVVILIVVAIVLNFILGAIMGGGMPSLDQMMDPAFMAGYAQKAGWQSLIIGLITAYPYISLSVKRVAEQLPHIKSAAAAGAAAAGVSEEIGDVPDLGLSEDVFAGPQVSGVDDLRAAVADFGSPDEAEEAPPLPEAEEAPPEPEAEEAPPLPEAEEAPPLSEAEEAPPEPEAEETPPEPEGEAEEAKPESEEESPEE